MVALREKSFEPASLEEAEKAQAVVMGIDRGDQFCKMREAALLGRQRRSFLRHQSR